MATKLEAKVQVVKTVYGKMVDPLTLEVYTQNPADLVRPSGWVLAQIEAGKMVVC